MAIERANIQDYEDRNKKLEALEQQLKPLEMGKCHSKIVRKIGAGWDKFVRLVFKFEWSSRQEHVAKKLNQQFTVLKNFYNEAMGEKKLETPEQIQEFKNINNQIDKQLGTIEKILDLLKGKEDKNVNKKISQAELDSIRQNLTELKMLCDVDKQRVNDLGKKQEPVPPIPPDNKGQPPAPPKEDGKGQPPAPPKGDGKGQPPAPPKGDGKGQLPAPPKGDGKGQPPVPPIPPESQKPVEPLKEEGKKPQGAPPKLEPVVVPKAKAVVPEPVVVPPAPPKGDGKGQPPVPPIPPEPQKLVVQEQPKPIQQPKEVKVPKKQEAAVIKEVFYKQEVQEEGAAPKVEVPQDKPLRKEEVKKPEPVVVQPPKEEDKGQKPAKDVPPAEPKKTIEPPKPAVVQPPILKQVHKPVQQQKADNSSKLLSENRFKGLPIEGEEESDEKVVEAMKNYVPKEGELGDKNKGDDEAIARRKEEMEKGGFTIYTKKKEQRTPTKSEKPPIKTKVKKEEPQPIINEGKKEIPEKQPVLTEEQKLKAEIREKVKESFKNDVGVLRQGIIKKLNDFKIPKENAKAFEEDINLLKSIFQKDDFLFTDLQKAELKTLKGHPLLKPIYDDALDLLQKIFKAEIDLEYKAKEEKIRKELEVIQKKLENEKRWNEFIGKEASEQQPLAKPADVVKGKVNPENKVIGENIISKTTKENPLDK